MTTLDQFVIRATPNSDAITFAQITTIVLVLGLGAIALTAPPAEVSATWHGNVAASSPR